MSSVSNEGGVAGSDFPAISNVINWLLETYYDSKDENKLRYRKFSIIQYSKVFSSSAKDESRGTLLSQDSTLSDDRVTLTDQNDHIPRPSKLKKCEPKYISCSALVRRSLRRCFVTAGLFFQSPHLLVKLYLRTFLYWSISNI